MSNPRITMPDGVVDALRYLRLALACLDEADEVKAPPYIQMAIDVLEGSDGDDGLGKTRAFGF